MLQPRLLRELTLERRPGDVTPAHVSAASGIAVIGEHVYVVVDDEKAIGRWPLRGNGGGRLFEVLPGRLPRDPAERKAVKADLEALARVPGGLLALGSGSSPRRRRAVLWPVERGERPRVGDLTRLYAALEREIGPPNVEGATVDGETLLLAHRGVGPRHPSAIVRVALRPVLRALAHGEPAPADAVEGIELHHPGEIDGVPLGITDIDALPDGRIVFSAAAEDAPDAAHDGEVTGSAIGILGGRPPRRVAGGHKVEGVTAITHPGGVRLLLVADPDDRSVPAPLLTVEGPAR